jgi:DNA-binding response OmpR family regulator
MVKPLVIQLIDDHEDFAAGIKAVLELEGYRVQVHRTAQEGLAFARAAIPDLVIVDLLLPDAHGSEIVQQLRDLGPRTPVMVVSACADEVDRIVAFRAGADDYVTKPFSLMELLARIDALLRRAGAWPDGGRGPGSRLRVGPRVELDLRERSVYRDGEPVHLAPKEYDLLVALVERRGAVVPRREITEAVWGSAHRHGSRTLDAHIFDLRRKLEDDPTHPRLILTVRDRGFRVAVDGG